MNIGGRLKAWRKANGLSQSDIEACTGVIPSCIALVENGEMTPTLQMLEAWAKALGVELYQAFLGENEQPRLPKFPRLSAQERSLLELFGEIPSGDRRLLVSLAHELARQARRPKHELEEGSEGP